MLRNVALQSENARQGSVNVDRQNGGLACTYRVQGGDLKAALPVCAIREDRPVTTQ